MGEVTIRAMTSTEFESLRGRLISGYAAAHVEAGDWAVETAEDQAAAETERLLPLGVDTPGMLLLTAVGPDGGAVGHLWLALERAQSGHGAWIYDIEIAPAHRGQGYGRSLLAVAEQEAAKREVSSIGLNVFGSNSIARNLYESAGYGIASMQLRKTLDS